jgi:signal transduction histidine kinase
MFREAIGKLSLRQKLTLLVTVGVLLPVVALSYVQYRSLVELQNKNKAAFKDNLRQGLTVVEQRMKERLADLAVQALDPVAGGQLSSSEQLEKHFAEVKRFHPEVEDIFVFGNPGLPAPSHALVVFERAQLAQSFLDEKRKYLFFDNYLFYPFDDTSKEQSRFAGLVLTESFVRDGLIARSLGERFNMTDTDGALLAITVTVTDENQQVVYSNAAGQSGPFFEGNFDRPFSNWRAAIGLRNTNIDNLARYSVLHNAGATFLALVFLLGGIALTIRAMDREARLAQAKSDFVSNVSHELKTPLSLISLFSEILELGRVNTEEKKNEYYRIIRHESRRLNNTIDNILDFSRIEAGRKKYELVDGDMAEVIDNVLSTHRYQITNSGFDVQTNFQSDLPPVLIDREAMSQAISNLLDNAIKYSGKIKQVSISAEKMGPDLSIEIADHGIGIPRAEQARVFEKFYRVGDGLVHDVKGSGLGLSLVKHIVEAHNGTISVQSDVGKGSRFTILLPLSRNGD